MNDHLTASANKGPETRPEVCMDEHLAYLTKLRDSGETNMFGARPYLMREFPDLTKSEALAICVYWRRSA